MKKCTVKTCAKKGEWQPTENFHKSHRTKDDLADECKTCCSERTKKHNRMIAQQKDECNSMFISYTKGYNQ